MSRHRRNKEDFTAHRRTALGLEIQQVTKRFLHHAFDIHLVKCAAIRGHFVNIPTGFVRDTIKAAFGDLAPCADIGQHWIGDRSQKRRPRHSFGRCTDPVVGGSHCLCEVVGKHLVHRVTFFNAQQSNKCNH